MFGTISGIEPSDKIDVKNVQKPQTNNFIRVSRNIINFVYFFLICLLMKYKKTSKTSRQE